MVVEVTSRVGRHLWRQRIVVPYGATGPLTGPGRLTEMLCDGTSGQILTPAFRGPHSLPLRIAITGHTPLAVSLVGPDGQTISRRLVTPKGRSLKVVFGSAGLRPGTYRVTVAAPGFRQRVQLTALAL
jgi:hypothetical protein